jgi:hypothetical protein
VADELGFFSVEDGARIARATRIVESWSDGKPPTPGDKSTHERGVRVYNDSGEEIPSNAIMVADAFDNAADPYNFVKVKKTSTTFNPQIIVNTARQIPTTPAAERAGFIPYQQYYTVQYDSGTPARGEGWGIKPGQWTISKGFPGCRIVGVINSTSKLALVELVPVTQLYGKCVTAISANTLATGNKYEIWAGTGATWADGGWTTVPDAYNRGGAIAVNDPVWLSWTGNAWFIGKIC